MAFLKFLTLKGQTGLYCRKISPKCVARPTMSLIWHWLLMKLTLRSRWLSDIHIHGSPVIKISVGIGIELMVCYNFSWLETGKLMQDSTKFINCKHIKISGCIRWWDVGLVRRRVDYKSWPIMDPNEFSCAIKLLLNAFKARTLNIDVNIWYFSRK